VTEDDVKRRTDLFGRLCRGAYEMTCWAEGVDPGLKEQLDAERPDIDLSGHDARVAAAKDAGSYLEYRLRCEAAGVEPSSESGYRIERAAASFQGIS